MDPELATQITAEPCGFGSATLLSMAGTLLSKASEHVIVECENTDRDVVQIPVSQRIRRGNESSGGKGG
jgi:hypothetical protein